MKFPSLDRFPGVSVETRPHTADRGLDVHATFEARACSAITDATVARVRVAHGDMANLVNHAVRSAATAVMTRVALIILRRVRRDWSGLWVLRMEIIGSDGGHGLVTRIDYEKRAITITWNDKAETGDFGFDEALGFLERGDWRLS